MIKRKLYCCNDYLTFEIKLFRRFNALSAHFQSTFDLLGPVNPFLLVAIILVYPYGLLEAKHDLS